MAVHQSGVLNNILNYRSIFILSIPCELFKFLIEKKLEKCFSNVIVSQHYGFLSQCAIVTICFNGKVMGKCDEINTDFSKAFNRVGHSILLYKLSTYTLCVVLLQWFRSTLIRVKIIALLLLKIYPEGLRDRTQVFYFFIFSLMI